MCQAHMAGLRFMPKGVERTPSDAIGLAVLGGKIATGEVEDEREGPSSAAVQLGSKVGNKRAKNMRPERHAEIARKAAENDGNRAGSE